MSDTLFNVEAYHQETPCRVEVCDPSWEALEAKASAIAIGKTITTRSGEAVVTRAETAGHRTILWADYGSGVEHPHIQENLLAPEQLDSKPRAAKPRRHSRKGEASGWIKERIGNKKRRNPSTSYYYCWQDANGRHSDYIPAGKVWRCNQMIENRCSVDEILGFLAGGRQGELRF